MNYLLKFAMQLPAIFLMIAGMETLTDNDFIATSVCILLLIFYDLAEVLHSSK